MISWSSLGAVTLVVLSALLLTLVGRRRFRAQGLGHDRRAFQDRLREVEREVDWSLSSGSEVEATLIDIKRRLLLTARHETSLIDMAPRLLTRRRRVCLLALIAGITLGATLALSDAEPPTALADTVGTGIPAGSGIESVETLVAHLAARLQAQPEDVGGWRKLGWSYVNLGRYQDAAWAYGKAAALRQDSAAYYSAYGEATVFAAGGRVTAEALSIFETALAIDSAEPRARFYFGLAQHQAGNKVEALAIWSSIIEDAAPAAAWLPDLHSRRAALARELGLTEPDLSPAVADAAAEPAESPVEGIGDS
ncbi:MAG: c-type cytochrome biogenesis protein CcmI [Kiloniellales bacterium]|nr:c-type cytochrome biogenesis protein CcmI [Kiloniellales bacterium]